MIYEVFLNNESVIKTDNKSNAKMVYEYFRFHNRHDDLKAVWIDKETNEVVKVIKPIRY